MALLELREMSITLVKARGQQRLVQALSLSLGAGEVCALIGRSGSGKSSLLNAVAGFLPTGGKGRRSPWDWSDDAPTRAIYDGRILVAGQEIDHLDVENRRDLGFVMQGGLVYDHLSLFDNLAFPLRSAGRRSRADLRAQVLTLIDCVGLDVARHGSSMDELLRKRGRSFSGGERQRIALGRLLAKDPRVFLLDEAFANLDPLLRLELFERVVALVKGGDRCALVITHDLSDLRLVDRIVLLGDPENGAAGQREYVREGADFRNVSSTPDAAHWTQWEARIHEIGSRTR